MSTCSLGVSAFRSSLHIAGQHLSRPTTTCRLLIAPLPITRQFSLLSRQTSQTIIAAQRQQICTRNAQWQPLLRTNGGIRGIKVFGPAVVTNYVDLPPNYTDEAGLPFARAELDAREVVVLFGPGMSTHAANKLLRILHGRRVAGTLEDPMVRVNTMQFNKRQQKVALDYLRKHVAVDEIVNAGLRAEDELAALEGETFEQLEPMAGEDPSKKKDIGYSTRFKLFKEENSAPAAPFAKESRPPKDEVYGSSAFDAIRARNEAKWAEELKRREEERIRKQQEEEERLAKLGPLATVDGQTRQVSPRMQEWMDQATSDLEAPPEMKKWERLLPSTVFVLLVVGGLYAYAEFYQSPTTRGDRLFPDIPPAAATVGALIAANVLIWGLWRLPPAWKVMNRFCLLVAATPKPVSIIGAMFSHQKFGHLVTNMLFLWFFGVRLHDEVGRGDFLATYFSSGALGFLGTLYSLVLRNQLHLTTLGASGAVYGVAAAYFWMHRFEGFKILGLPPDPYNGVQGLAFIGLMLAVNISAIFSKNHMLDIASHIVGISVGVAAGHLLQKKQDAKQQEKKLKEQGGRTDMGVVGKIMEKK
ncbi:hypothetical protein QBC46DRAFT_371966 [Diplogelasinospora grovesii]|uniref:Peptidase S54 rhomboid domain-containing protein n=1 Tax=Diplogelasinospora grovesii TaxID=303347 RepID=A0AAN6NGH4_9PEZI|nr:hypothetical protein QBC46DRAFT_371966 [Diplogelasinospora grovesii]